MSVIKREEISTGDNYSSLAEILTAAYDQAANGKGKERHATGEPFDEQPIVKIQEMLTDHPFAGLAFQIIKKTIEAGRLYRDKGSDAAMPDILGVLVYASAMGVMARRGK